MFKHFTATDSLMLVSAFASLIVAEVLWFSGARESALFVGLWVPSILGFAAYLKLIRMNAR